VRRLLPHADNDNFTPNKRKEKMNAKIRQCLQIDAVRSLVSGRIHRRSEVSLGRFAIAGLLVFAAAGLVAMSMQPPKLPWATPLIPTGNIPLHIVVDRATNTIYVANNLDTTISVIDGKNCSAGPSSKCTPITTITAGPNPTDLILDAAHRTVYATLAGGNSNSIAVVDISSCNAGNTSGCSQTPKQVVFPGSTFYLGGAANVPFGLGTIVDLDDSTHTLYVPDINEGPVYILDTSTCNGSTPGCTNPVITAAQGDGVVIDQSEHSVYVFHSIDGTNQVQILDSSTCNSINQSQCGTPPTSGFTTNADPFVPAAVDEVTHTLYLPQAAFNNTYDFISVIDTSTCNASTTVGCGNAAQVQVQNTPIAAVFDPQTKTVYVENQGSSSISVVNGATCNAMNHSGCNQKPRILATGIDPAAFGYNPTTQTLYVSSQDTDFAWVLDGSKCNAMRSDGCTKTAPISTAGAASSGLDLNPNTKTLYVTNEFANTVSVIDSALCNQRQPSGCNQTWKTVNVGFSPFSAASNKTTNTIYVSNFGDGTLSVINGATCNANADTSCSQSQPTTVVGSGPVTLIVDEATNTIYVTNQNDGTVSVVDGTHCQGSDVTGCNPGQGWPAFTVGLRPQALTINPINHTLYVATTGAHIVSVINTLHCNSRDSTDCTVKATIPMGNAPRSIGVLLDKNTVFVGNRNDLTVSIFDGSTCNGSSQTGCPQSPPPTVLIGAFPNSAGNNFDILGRGIAIDQTKHLVFVPTIADSDLVVLDGNVCRAGHVNDCEVKIADQRMGGLADFVTVDESSETVYVTNNQDGTVSVAQDK
jgi:YVTN family beta-propeller protein